MKQLFDELCTVFDGSHLTNAETRTIAQLREILDRHGYVKVTKLSRERKPQVGDTVFVRPYFGGDQPHEATIKSISRFGTGYEVLYKSGQVGYDLKIEQFM